MASMSIQTDCSNMSESNLTSEEVSEVEKRQDRDASSFISSNETSESEMQANWSELPSPLIEKIYSFLPRKDQVNMSLVCRSWSEGYGSPSVWKTFRFSLTESQLSKDPCPVMKFVEKYSSMFRHVEIEAPYFNRVLKEKLCRLLTECLEILSRTTQLNSIEFQFIFIPFSLERAVRLRNLHLSVYNDICAAIAKFLSSQLRLKRVKFHSCPFGYADFFKLFRILFESNRESLTHLHLRSPHRKSDFGIFKSDANAAINVPLLADLPNLKTIDTDNSIVFHEMLNRQATALRTVENCQKLPLSLISVECHNFIEMGDFREMKSDDWLCLRTLYPNLRIKLIIRYFPASQEVFESFILRNMPLSHLYVESNSREDISVLFDYLIACNVNEHLVSLRVDVDGTRQNLFSAINPFIQAFKRLKCLELFLINSHSGLVDLLESWVENRPECLENFSLDFIEDEREVKDMEKIKDYASFFKLTGLNIHCRHPFSDRI